MLDISSCVHRSLAALSLMGALAACNTDPGKGKAAAQVAEAIEVKSAAASSAASKYTFSAANSKLEFTGAKVTGKHSGSFGDFSGSIVVDPTAVTQGAVTVDIKMDSLTADHPKLTVHLKSPELFDVAKYPSATFTSSSIAAGGSNGATHTITGNLDLHGVTKAITFPATLLVTAEGVSVDAEFSINRQDFGVKYPGMPDDLIKDDLLLKLQIRAKKAS